jgi:cation transport regulator ChaB
MPKTTKSGSARKSELPSTIAKSDEHAQRTFAKAHDSAAEEYGEGRRAHQTAYAALKHSYEKVGDHWERKDEKGPSDQHAAESRGSRKPTAGGVNANATKSHLMDVARRLDIRGRSKMTKDELVQAIQRANERARRS